MRTVTALTQSRDLLGFFAVKVRSRGECTVSKTLRHKGFEVLAPTSTPALSLLSKSRKAESALFPGYVFVRLDPRELLSLVTTEGVSYVVRNGSGLIPLPLEEELTVQSLCVNPTSFEPCNNFVVGQRVSIESGPLSGRQATLVRIGEKDRLVLSLNTIFSSVSVDLHDTIVRSCN